MGRDSRRRTSSYEEDLKTMVQILVTKDYYDLQLNRQCKVGDVLTVNKVRAEYISDSGYAVIKR